MELPGGTSPTVKWESYLIPNPKQKIKQKGPKTSRLAGLIEQVAVRGLGIRRQHLYIAKPRRGGTHWRINNWDLDAIEDHIKKQ